jgi:Uncharacterized protein, possibly involved in utilization of glycolate and propanediol
MAHLRDVRALTLDAAKAMAAAAERFASERGWTVAVAVVDAAGGLILFHCLEDTQPGSQDIAVLKARTAARLHRTTKALEDGIAGGRPALLTPAGRRGARGRRSHPGRGPSHRGDRRERDGKRPGWRGRGRRLGGPGDLTVPGLGGRPWDEWIARYGRSHEHPCTRRGARARLTPCSHC